MTENAVDRRIPVLYDPALALAICEEIASGKSLKKICEVQGMPTRQTVYKWLSVYPKFFDAYERAREISAQSIEDEALDMARVLVDQNDFSGTKVQAYNIAMQQLRWSAGHRDPNRYGSHTNQSSTVPIQITTTLNLGQDGVKAVDNQSSVYSVSVEIGQKAETKDNLDELDYNQQMIDVTPTASDNTGLAFGLPESEKQQLHNPKIGRPHGTAKGVVGRRKTVEAALATAKRYENAEIKRKAKAEAQAKKEAK